MSSTLFWHGTPADIPSAAIEPRSSFFEGIWLSSAPEIAAHYAGMGGWVHGFVPAAEAKLLLATGHRATKGPYAYPDAETWEAVRDFLVTVERADLDYFDALCPFKIEHGFSPALGPEGQPSWEALFQDFCEMDETPVTVLEMLGIDGLLQGETPEQAMGDRRGDPKDRTHAALLRALHRVKEAPILTLGVRGPDALVPVCRLPARQVADAFLAGHGMARATEADLARWTVTPRLEARVAPRM